MCTAQPVRPIQSSDVTSDVDACWSNGGKTVEGEVTNIVPDCS